MTSSKAIYPENLSYVYKITNIVDGRFYIGLRYANVTENRSPEADLLVHYFTSGAMKSSIMDSPESHVHEILFRSNEEILVNGVISLASYWYEQLLIKNSISNELCMNINYIDPDTGTHVFSTANTKRSSSAIESQRSSMIKYHAKLTTPEKESRISSQKISWHSKSIEEIQDISKRRWETIRNNDYTLSNRSLKISIAQSAIQQDLVSSGNHVFQTDAFKKQASIRNKNMWDEGTHPLQTTHNREKVANAVSSAQSKLVMQGAHVFQSTEFKQEQSARTIARTKMNVARPNVIELEKLQKLLNIKLGKGWKLKSNEWIDMKILELTALL